MDTCFLYTRHLDANGCLCLKILSNGELVSPPAYRNFEEIRNLQQDARTLIIESTNNASLLELELPWLPDRKARIAIPFALEEKLAQPVEELHFAFDKTRYQNKRYLIVVLDKKHLNNLMAILDEQRINFETITLDWFALSSEQSCITESETLINSSDFKGALDGALAVSYLKNHPHIEPLLFKDSMCINSDILVQTTEELSYTWIAKKLIQTNPLNLCQGDFQHGNSSDWIKKGYQSAALLAGIWLLSMVVFSGIKLHFLKKQTIIVDEQIAQIYREFFPEAKQVISPKFRISQLLGTSANNQNRFWLLLNQFSKVMRDTPGTIEQLRFQNKTLSVKLLCNDFASLEEIENKLKNLQLKVNQTQAATRDQHVIATLELT
ncbi:MAG TPA: type II secretion system protein GspL [Legionella sp.]|nr:type II secretion system protein GspL [Legionella sp.]